MIPFQELKERKLGQWAITYLAAVWLLLQAIDLIGGYFGWPAVIGQLATVVFGIGFLGVLVLAWYHGEKGQQRVSGPELVMIAALLLMAGIGVAMVTPAGRADPEPPAATALGSAFAPDAPVAEQGSIAVLPFENMSADPDNEYFSDGITEELLNVLAQLPELRVASRTSAFSFKDSRAPIDSIARALNVRHVLEGSVRKAEDRVRITAQLIDASTGYHLWSETYDRRLEDIFAVQDEIASAIVGELQIELGDGRAGARLAKEETGDPEAHTLVLKAFQIGQQSTKEAFAEAESLLKQALRRDPEYARAQASLASIYESRVYFGYVAREEGLARARLAAERALALDSSEARAHYVLGLLSGDYDWDWRAADQHFARAIELNPGLSAAYGHRAWLLLRLGRNEEAIRLAERTVELDPVSWAAHNTLGVVYAHSGRLEEATETFREADQLAPGNPLNLSSLALTLPLLGLHEEAIHAGEKAVDAAPASPSALAALGYAYASAGQRNRAERVLAQLRGMQEVSPYRLALVHAGLGNREQALRRLEQAVEERDVVAAALGVDPAFRGYRGEPRVRSLLERMGLPTRGD